jgi:CRP/FNR family cyclic AMP-dependent transcriptional regulator
MKPANAPSLSALVESEFNTIANIGQIKRYAKDTVVLSEGDQSYSLYAINRGQVKVFLCNEDGNEIILNILGAGDYFGEMSLLDDNARSASVMTLEESELTIISRQDFRSCMSKSPEVVERIMLDLITRLRTANRKIGSLAFLDVYGRVYSTLLQLAREQDGRLIVATKMSHQDIANIVGASREMVSRIMRNLVKEGYILIEQGKKIVICEKPL